MACDAEGESGAGAVRVEGRRGLYSAVTMRWSVVAVERGPV